MTSHPPPREWISLNAGWRFFKYPVAEQADALIYEARPTVNDYADDRAAEARRGTLEVIATKNGEAWAAARVETVGAANKLILEPDRAAVRADGLDFCFGTARVVDTPGRTVPRAKNPLRFLLEGPGEIVATDNGDPTNLVFSPSHERAALNGLCRVIVWGIAGQPGAIRLHAESDGLQGASLLLRSETGT